MGNASSASNNKSRKKSQPQTKAIKNQKGRVVVASTTTTTTIKKKTTTNAATASSNSSSTIPLMEQLTVSLKEPNTTHDVWQDYEKVQRVANGSTCQVWTVKRRLRHNNTDNDNSSSTTTTTIATTTTATTLYALKIMDKASMSSSVLDEMRNEVTILRTLDHPNIVRIYDWYESATHSYMVMEYCSGGHLLGKKPYTEVQVAGIMRQVLRALQYLHKRGIVHRDLKPENIVYDHQGETATPKLIDFGLSKQNMTGLVANMQCKVGTLLSMSPQVLQGDYNNKADIWSVGTIAYTLLSGVRPFDGDTQRDIVFAILNDGKYKPMVGPAWEHISSAAKDFCAALLTYNPKERPSAQQALSHAWLRHYSKSARRGSKTATAETMTRIHNALLASSQQQQQQQQQHGDNKQAGTTRIFEGLVAMMVAHYQTSSNKESLQEYRDAFADIMDPANTGRITYWQFRKALQQSQCNDNDLDESTIQDMFACIDWDQDGSIQYTEFLALILLARGQFEQEDLAAAFDKLDVDRTGFISRQDLCRLLGSYCSRESTCDSVVESILERYDSDKDDQISYDDFVSIFREKAQKGLEDKCCAVLEQGPQIIMSPATTSSSSDNDNKTKTTTTRACGCK